MAMDPSAARIRIAMTSWTSGAASPNTPPSVSRSAGGTTVYPVSAATAGAAANTAAIKIVPLLSAPMSFPHCLQL